MTIDDNDDDIDDDKGLPTEGRLTRRQSRLGFPVRVVVVVAVACVSLYYSSTHYTTTKYYSPMSLVTTTTTTTMAVVVDVGGDVNLDDRVARHECAGRRAPSLHQILHHHNAHPVLLPALQLQQHNSQSRSRPPREGGLDRVHEVVLVGPAPQEDPTVLQVVGRPQDGRPLLDGRLEGDVVPVQVVAIVATRRSPQGRCCRFIRIGRR